MKRNVKKLIAAVAAFVLSLLLCGCAAKQPAAAPDAAPAAAEPNAAATPAAEYGSNAAAQVLGAVAYSYAQGEGSALYAAVEYKNAGDCPIIITEAKLELSAGSAGENASFTPELNEYLVLLPGETGYIVRWLGPTSIPAGESITVAAELTAQKCAERGARITVADLYAADNYPNVTTLSGKLSCQAGRACTANMIFVGFYDDAARFLGAWYFAKNALFEGGDSQKFVIDMQGLPLENISQTAAEIRGIGFGFDF